MLSEKFNIGVFNLEKWLFLFPGRKINTRGFPYHFGRLDIPLIFKSREITEKYSPKEICLWPIYTNTYAQKTIGKHYEPGRIFSIAK